MLRIQRLTRQSPDSQGVYGVQREPRKNIISGNDKYVVTEHAGTLGGPQEAPGTEALIPWHHLLGGEVTSRCVCC